MTKITLPPLPAPDIWVREDFGLGDSTVHQGFTAEQMQERDRQIAAAYAAEVERLQDLLGKANALARIRGEQVEQIRRETVRACAQIADEFRRGAGAPVCAQVSTAIRALLEDNHG